MSSPTFRPIPAGSGTGDMTKAVYDTDDSGTVDDSTLWDGEALPSVDDATGGQVLALKSDKSALEFATVSGGASAYGDLTDIPAAIASIDGLTPAANKIPYYTAADAGALMDVPERGNLIINGDFSVAQRGTSFVSDSWRPNSDDSYLLDRWLLLSDGNDIVDVTQIASPFSRSRYALQAEVETANKRFGVCQIIEANTCIPLRGQKISISFAAKTATSKVINNVRVAVLEWTSTADAVTSDVVANWATDLTWATNWAALNTPANLALTTSEQTFKVEDLTVGASCNNLAVFVWVDDTDCAADDILQLGEVQIVRGSTAPEFVATDDIFACMRRNIKLLNTTVATRVFAIGGYTWGDSYADAFAQHPVVMAGGPTCYTFGSLQVMTSTANYDITVLNANSTDSMTLFRVTKSGANSNGESAVMCTKNDGGAHGVYLEAEL